MGSKKNRTSVRKSSAPQADTRATVIDELVSESASRERVAAFLERNPDMALPEMKVIGPGMRAGSNDRMTVIEGPWHEKSVSELLAEEFRKEQEAEEELYPDVAALIPWERAPEYAWMLAILWRADGSLEAYWHRGADRLPAYELEHASNEFFEACQELPKDGSAIGFQRSYGARPANPWDWDFAIWFHAWWRTTWQEQNGILLQSPNPNYKRPKEMKPNTLAAHTRLWASQIRTNHFLH